MVKNKRRMTKYLMVIGSYILPVLVLANGGDNHEEDISINHQIEELLPFEHFGEGHWFAFVLSIILWLSLIYAIFSLIQRFRGPKTKV